MQRSFALGGVRLRVERKEWVDTATRRFSPVKSGASPREHLYTDSQEAMAVLFQRGVTIGMANAAAASQAQVSPSPLFTQYPYYPPYSQMPYGSYIGANPQMDIEASSGLSAHGNTYMSMPMGQFQYPQAPAYVQYQPVSQRPVYQWPPANSTDNTNTTSTTASAIASTTAPTTAPTTASVALNSDEAK